MPAMNGKLFATVFVTVFLAELGDKTQLATLSFAAGGRHSKALVFLASSAALTASSALGVLGGAVLPRFVGPRALTLASGVLFVALGAWTLWKAAAMEPT